MFKYIIKGNNSKAIACRSEMNLFELQGYVRLHSKKLHPEGFETVFHIGAIELVDPKVMTPEDFVNFCPYIM